MPYSDRWGITATKQGADTYTAQHPDSPLSPVTVNIVMPVASELVNVGAALCRAIQALWPEMPAPWANRYAYAMTRHKIDAYTALISGSSGQLRTLYTNKRTYWNGEEARLKAIMGSDA